MIQVLKQKARAIVWRLRPCSRAKYNALVLSLAEEERRLKKERDIEEELARREDEAWERILERRYREAERVARNRKDIMQFVMSAKTQPASRESTQYIVVNQAGEVIQSLRLEGSSR